jgi:hypothetical protein
MKILLLACAGAAAAGLTLGVDAAQITASVSAQAQPVPDAVVVAVPEGGARPPDRPPLGVVDQLNKEFLPYVTPIRAGSLVQFPNRDHIRHHVYSFSPASRSSCRCTSARPHSLCSSTNPAWSSSAATSTIG